jgi:hypothetical protein
MPAKSEKRTSKSTVLASALPMTSDLNQALLRLPSACTDEFEPSTLSSTHIPMA